MTATGVRREKAALSSYADLGIAGTIPTS